MRKINNYLLLSFVVINVACNNPNNTTKIPAPEGMHVLDLSRYGKPFSIFVPDTVKNQFMVSEQSNGSLDISAGKNFAVSIYEQSADIALRKEDIKADEVNKLQEIIKQDDSTLIWKSQVTTPECHFVLNKKIRNSEYSFEDTRSTDNNGFGQDAIIKMYDACNAAHQSK